MSDIDYSLYLWYIVYNRLRKKKIIGEQQLKEQELKNQVAQLEEGAGIDILA